MQENLTNPETSASAVLAQGPLSGIRVVEYGVFHAGPGASAILGDLGAEVIKIETGHGDPERFWNVLGGVDITVPGGESIMFEISNRNKKGLHLDIQKEKGREVFRRLVATADVFLTNLRLSTTAALGIDYESVRRINPAIIHAGVSGYGEKGPAADLGAFDPMGQARSGMMYLYDDQNPALIHMAVLDQAAAITTSHAILAALFARERHGIAQSVHTSLYSSGLWLMYCNLYAKSVLNRDTAFAWKRYENSPLRNSFQCADGQWIIGVHHPEGKYWEKFCEITGQQELLSDSRFGDAQSRRSNVAELVAIFDRVLATRTCDEWIGVFQRNGLMFTPVQHIGEVLDDPQALENAYVVEFDHPAHGRVKLPGYPARFSAAQAGMRAAAPAPGEHSREILLGLGYGEDDLAELREQEVIR
ncbi:MAG: CoA transferase [Deltaproteobacteria bacterium]|nr:CoA transferase [Deltaproteobacteria bacterium]